MKNNMKSQNISDIVYLVDLENIGTTFLYQHIKEHMDDEYIIFYSENTAPPDVMLENMPVMFNVSFIDCKTGSNNAMDFCICVIVGRLSADADKEIRILSDDKGYDSILNMLHQQGVHIKRERAACRQSFETGKQTDQKVLSDKDLIIHMIKANVSKRYQNDLITAFSDNVTRQEAHAICQSVMPQKMATDIYKKLRKYIPKEVS